MARGYPSRLAWTLWVLALLLLPGVILQLSLNWVGPTDYPFRNRVHRGPARLRDRRRDH